MDLGLKVGTIVDVKKFIPGPGPLFVEVQGAHIAIVNVEGFVIAGDELHEYDLPGDMVFVEVKGKEKQLSSMKPGEKEKISSIAGNSEFKAELEHHWIKEGNTVKALHRQESEAHSLMVLVKGTCHHIPKGLTEKIYIGAA
ncbi:MAG: FeoA domain-containing protein [Thermodesulfobacteriota bacterium]|nr:FeoA domain-containing protein [Thermodesulfobacteriota bacterium]